MATTERTTGGRLRVTLLRSPIGYKKDLKQVVEGLGLRRMGHTVEVTDHPAMRGMIFKIRHMVRVEER